MLKNMVLKLGSMLIDIAVVVSLIAAVIAGLITMQYSFLAGLLTLISSFVGVIVFGFMLYLFVDMRESLAKIAKSVEKSKD